MTQIHWLNDVSGSFINPAEWSGGVVPRSADDAILNPAGVTPFTVGLAVNAEVNSIQTSANATLAINGKLFRAVNGTGAGVNAGTISVGYQSIFQLEGTLDNSGRVDLHGLMTTGPATGSLTLTGGGVVTEYSRNGVATHGRIEGGDLTNVDETIVGGVGFGGTEGLYLRLAGVLTNEAGGSLINYGLNRRGEAAEIRASTIMNDGVIASSGYNLQIQSTTLVNTGELSLEPLRVLSQHLQFAGDYLSNSGTISLDGSSGIFLASSLVNTGTITNLDLDVASFDSGRGTPSYNMVNSGVVLQTGSGSINLGSSQGLGSISNAGTISASNGQIAIYGGQGGEAMTSNSGLIETSGAGAVTLWEAMTNSGRLEAAGGRLTAKGDISNNGRLEASGGTLTVYGAVNGTGLGVITGGVLDFEGAFQERVQFLGGASAAGTLRLAQSQSYTGAVFGFALNGKTALDLEDIAFVGAGEASYSGTAAKGVLTVTDGTHTSQIHFVGDYLNATFTAASDGAGGTLITASSIHKAFVAAAASLGGGSSGLAHTIAAPQPVLYQLANPAA